LLPLGQGCCDCLSPAHASLPFYLGHHVTPTISMDGTWLPLTWTSSGALTVVQVRALQPLWWHTFHGTATSHPSGACFLPPLVETFLYTTNIHTLTSLLLFHYYQASHLPLGLPSTPPPPLHGGCTHSPIHTCTGRAQCPLPGREGDTGGGWREGGAEAFAHTCLLPRVPAAGGLLGGGQEEVTTPPHPSLRCRSCTLLPFLGVSPLLWVISSHGRLHYSAHVCTQTMGQAPACLHVPHSLHLTLYLFVGMSPSSPLLLNATLMPPASLPSLPTCLPFLTSCQPSSTARALAACCCTRCRC